MAAANRAAQRDGAAAAEIMQVTAYTGKAQRTRDAHREEERANQPEPGEEGEHTKEYLATTSAMKLIGKDVFKEFKRQLDQAKGHGVGEEGFGQKIRCPQCQQL